MFSLDVRDQKTLITEIGFLRAICLLFPLYYLLTSEKKKNVVAASVFCFSEIESMISYKMSALEVQL